MYFWVQLLFLFDRVYKGGTASSADGTPHPLQDTGHVLLMVEILV